MSIDHFLKDALDNNVINQYLRLLAEQQIKTEQKNNQLERNLSALQAQQSQHEKAIELQLHAAAQLTCQVEILEQRIVEILEHRISYNEHKVLQEAAARLTWKVEMLEQLFELRQQVMDIQSRRIDLLMNNIGL